MNTSPSAIRRSVLRATGLVVLAGSFQAVGISDAPGVEAEFERRCGEGDEPRRQTDPTEVLSCLKYHYDGEDTLIVHHTRAVFNCCARAVVANAEVDDTIITIEPHVLFGEEGPCLCHCVYDVRYRVSGVHPGRYRLAVKEGSLNRGDEPLGVNVSLLRISSGKQCEARHGTPWSYRRAARRRGSRSARGSRN